MKHPTLYKRTSAGASQQWDISTENNVIITRWGQVDGAIQETRDAIASGKNLGKKNETTAEEQAALEAASQWEKKLKKGYVQDLGVAVAGGVDAIIEGGVFPMLAHKFIDQGHKLVYPCFVQPKLDGHRCIAVVKDGKATLWSRTRKQITSMSHIVASLEAMELAQTCDFILDGELYNHAYKDRFEELTGFIRSPNPTPGSGVVEYHVYDIVNEHPQIQRTKMLRDMCLPLSQFIAPGVVFVITMEAEDEDALMAAFTRFREAGYEGAIARNAQGTYANKRSTDLLKIKEFDEDDFQIIGVEEGRGKLAGHGIFVCTTVGGSAFRAKLVGETANLKQFFENPKLAVGKLLNVKYQGITKKSGVPRFPIANRIVEPL